MLHIQDLVQAWLIVCPYLQLTTSPCNLATFEDWQVFDDEDCLYVAEQLSMLHYQQQFEG
jgi:hypothetical protein